MKELNFYWRIGDYALKVGSGDTIHLVKYYQHEGKEYNYSIGYFWYDDHEPCWELKFVGDRFKEILDGDVVAIFTMLRAAYDVLEEWKRDD